MYSQYKYRGDDDLRKLIKCKILTYRIDLTFTSRYLPQFKPSCGLKEVVEPID